MAAGDPMYAERKADKANPKKGPIESARIKRAENGGFIVTCSHPPQPSRSDKPMTWEPDKEYAFGSYGEADSFLQKAFGVGEAKK